MTPKEHFHGSDIEKIEQAYGISRENIVSFSANVNPLGVSYKLRETLTNHIDSITQYPDRDYTSLRQTISLYTGALADHIIVGNGSTELISLFIRVSKPKKALIVGPTYSEYEREVSLGGGISTYYKLSQSSDFRLDVSSLSAELTQQVDLLILCNPNNPTSSLIDIDQMKDILNFASSRSIQVIVDETYIEFTEEPDKVSAIPLVPKYDNLVVLRGTSKFFAAPGLRLGYAVCKNRALIADINRHKNPWTISSLAAIAGEIMFTDTEYIQKTRELINTERSRIMHLLETSFNYYPYKAHANFVLVRIVKEGLTSDLIFDRAMREGLMIRDCSDFPFLNNKYIRFCFMNPEDNDRLMKVLLS